MKTKIAIACQGDGSQTAFTAGVLKALCESHLQDEFEFVGLSGTSGGTLCATLVWYALRKGEQPAWRRLMAKNAGGRSLPSERDELGLPAPVLPIRARPRAAGGRMMGCGPGIRPM